MFHPKAPKINNIGWEQFQSRLGTVPLVSDWDCSQPVFVSCYSKGKRFPGDFDPWAAQAKEWIDHTDCRRAAGASFVLQPPARPVDNRLSPGGWWPTVGTRLVTQAAARMMREPIRHQELITDHKSSRERLPGAVLGCKEAFPDLWVPCRGGQHDAAAYPPRSRNLNDRLETNPVTPVSIPLSAHQHS